MQDEYHIQVVDLENVFNISKDIITEYCIEHQIEDEKKIHPNTWNDVLDEICQRIFASNPKILKTDSNTYNQYDKEKVLYIYDRVYKKLCNIYIQEICQQGFIILCGIDKQTLYNWSSGTLSTPSFDLQEKIREDNENSIWGLMRGDNGNSNKYFGKLNKYHGWNGSGTTNEKTKQGVLTAEDLPKLGNKMSVSGGLLQDNTDVIAEQ